MGNSAIKKYRISYRGLKIWGNHHLYGGSGGFSSQEGKLMIVIGAS